MTDAPRLFRTVVNLAAALAALVCASAAAAQPADTRSLAGWWIALDETFPKLAAAGASPAEEILIVNADGRFEDRVMNFFSGTAQVCAQRKVCSDLPTLFRGRLRVAGDRLTLPERAATSDRTNSPRADPAIRRAALGTTATWTVAGDKDVITLQAGDTARTLARIAPRRLMRLRAGFRASGLPAQKHWRCFLANATANDVAFASLRADRGEGAQTPDFLDRYLRVASYLATLDTLMRTPTPDDPATRSLIGSEPELFLVEDFPGVKPPVSMAEKQRLRTLIASVETRVRAKLNETAAAAPASERGGAISAADVAAYAAAAGDGEAAKKLWCRE